MSRNYDNWERLVDVVLKREQYWQMAHAHSRDTSISSLSSDFDEVSLSLASSSSSQLQRTRVQKVRSLHKGKRLRELSALIAGQDIQAHEGAILTMKFSLDGQYLASAGEDGSVRIWQVVEVERSDNVDISDADPSCMFLTVNHRTELAPLMVEKNKDNKFKSLRKAPDSACIVFPSKVFRILEKPLHVFQGHNGEILDLSWSINNCLISSSVDKTVRMWQVGIDQCLKVFLHTNYVTCVQFDPVNDDYFISGSIDGKVRIWMISGCQVVSWTEVKDIVTAVSYRPDGQGVIIGTFTGTCHFFSAYISDIKLQLEAQLCFKSRKSPCIRITDIQFSPQDPDKVLINCADSQVRILKGMNVIEKYEGFPNAGNQISASFSSDGKHIVSASEDSSVYVWNCNSQKVSSASQPNTIKSFECFSCDVSVAIPWSGIRIWNSENNFNSSKIHKKSIDLLPFSLDQEFLPKPNPRGSPTRPEQKLHLSTSEGTTSPLSKSQYKFLKTCYESSLSSHMWGLVIVTAGWDGRIRSYHNYGLPVPL